MNAAIWTIALVLDFTSPKAPVLLHHPFPHEGQVVQYPLKAREQNGKISSCSHVLEKFMPPEKVSDWSSKLRTDARGKLPIALAIDKIRFDLEFGLHRVDHVIIDARTDGEKDSCGANVCDALRRLESTLRKRGREMRIQSMYPLKCILPSPGALALVDASGMSATRIVKNASAPPHGVANARANARAKAQAPTAANAAANALSRAHAGALAPSGAGASASQASKGRGTMELQGPPVRVQLDAARGTETAVATFALQAPGSLQLAAGKWRITLLTPSWARAIPGVEIEIRKDAKQVINLDQAFSAQLQWVPSLAGQDQVLVIQSAKHSRRILIPAGSPAVPVPKSLAWKVYKTGS